MINSNYFSRMFPDGPTERMIDNATTQKSQVINEDYTKQELLAPEDNTTARIRRRRSRPGVALYGGMVDDPAIPTNSEADKSIEPTLLCTTNAKSSQQQSAL